MSLSLNVKREPYDLELLPGIVFRVRPLTTAMMEMARSAARRSLERVDDAPDVLIAAGWKPDDLPDLNDPDIRMGTYATLERVRVAQEAITAWTGMEDLDGNPLPVTDENVMLFMVYMQAEAELFWLKYTGILEQMAQIKNGLRPAFDGTSEAAGRDTARDAGKKACPAPKAEETRTASAAPTTNTRRASPKKLRPTKS